MSLVRNIVHSQLLHCHDPHCSTSTLHLTVEDCVSKYYNSCNIYNKEYIFTETYVSLDLNGRCVLEMT